MNPNAQRLHSLAQRYECKEFITSDPISFAHRFQKPKDIEIAAFVAQWVAYGKRELFLNVLDDIYLDFKPSAYDFIGSKQYLKYKDNQDCLYRFYKKNDFYLLCQALYNIYFVVGQGKKDLQDVLKEKIGTKTDDCLLVLSTLQSFFKNIKGIPNNTSSACKRLCMFLRWMIRKNSPVDFGLWDILPASDLIIPLDTHVFRQSQLLQLTSRHTPDMKTALEITSNLKEIFPNDPLKADFALFGFGVNKGEAITRK